MYYDAETTGAVKCTFSMSLDAWLVYATVHRPTMTEAAIVAFMCSATTP